MSENCEDFFTFLAEKRGFELPEGLSLPMDISSQAILQDFIQADQKRLPGRESFLSLIPQRLYPEGAESWREEVVQSHASMEPGFSSKLLKKPKKYIPSEAKETTILKGVIAAIVTTEQALDKNYIRFVINEEVARNVVAFCEDRIINGNGNQATGLLSVGGANPAARSGDENRTRFYCRALQEYTNSAGRAPTHIVLPYTAILELLAEQEIALAAPGSPSKLFGIPIIESNAISEAHGLILAVDEIVLASYPGLQWEFRHVDSEARNLDLARICLRCKMNLIIKHSKAIKKISLEG